MKNTINNTAFSLYSCLQPMKAYSLFFPFFTQTLLNTLKFIYPTNSGSSTESYCFVMLFDSSSYSYCLFYSGLNSLIPCRFSLISSGSSPMVMDLARDIQPQGTKYHLFLPVLVMKFRWQVLNVDLKLQKVPKKDKGIYFCQKTFWSSLFSTLYRI